MAENLGVKNAQWDRKSGFYTGDRNCYNSYIYLPESSTTSIPDKFILHGERIANNLDGGSALHLNLANLPDKEFFLWLRKLASKRGTNYWCSNVKSSSCSRCGNIDYRTLDTCPKCGSKDIEHATRVIGYNIPIKNFSKSRREEEAKRIYH